MPIGFALVTAFSRFIKRPGHFLADLILWIIVSLVLGVDLNYESFFVVQNVYGRFF
jgi:hypothetical protein